MSVPPRKIMMKTTMSNRTISIIGRSRILVLAALPSVMAFSVSSTGSFASRLSTGAPPPARGGTAPSSSLGSFAGRRTIPSHTTTALFSTTGIPEPGPCPGCADENSYWDGSTLFVCTACAHEWPVDSADDDSGGDNDVEEATTRDVNGNILETGDTCVLTQDLAKGKLKRGQRLKIRLGDFGDGHDCEATIAGIGTYALKSQFLKKV